MQKAKENVERYYPVVGILEEINATLEVFEHTLPYFFKGVQRVYFKDLFSKFLSVTSESKSMFKYFSLQNRITKKTSKNLM